MLESLNLDGKTAVVTGGGTGLGREMALALARAGANLIVASRRPGPIEATARGAEVLVLECTSGGGGTSATSHGQLYLGGGALGLGFFSPAGGPATYGYLGGFLAAALLVGYLAERGWDRSYRRAVAAMLAGNIVIYLVGLPWLGINVGLDLGATLSAGLTPFIPGDIVKLLLAAAALPSTWRLLGPRR